MPHVDWAEESKNGLRFEIGPSYGVIPTRSQLLTDGQFSCSLGLVVALSVCWKINFRVRLQGEQSSCILEDVDIVAPCRIAVNVQD